MKKRRRTIPLMFYVTPEERDQIEAKMAQLGTNNMSAYLRKIAIDGYVVQLDLPELREMVSLLRRSSNNLNQLRGAPTKRGAFTRKIWRTSGRIKRSCGNPQKRFCVSYLNLIERPHPCAFLRAQI